MIIPDKVHILGQDYAVEFKSKKHMKNDLGECNFDDNKIYLVNTMKEDKQGEIFLHECIHAIEGQMSLDLTEKQVNSLGVGIYAFLKENGYI